MSMTKRDLVVKIAKETGLIQKDVTAIVQMVLDGIADEIIAGNTVELRNFGVFRVVTCKSRKGRNPNRPEKEIIIPDRAVVKFRTGKELKKRLGQLNPESFK
jgi:DNA-binding protein HU-beta/integration host factor subunit alpha